MLNKKYLIAIVALMACLIASTALAGGVKDRMIQRKPQIDAMLANGTLGENNLGLLEYRGAEQGLAVVKEENQDRLMVYKAIAKKAGTTFTIVGQRRAVRIVEQAPAGTWLQDSNSRWYQK